MAREFSEKAIADSVMQRFQERLAAEAGHSVVGEPALGEDSEVDPSFEAIIVTSEVEARYMHLDHMDHDDRIRRIKECEVHRLEEAATESKIASALAERGEADYRDRMGPTAEALVDALLPDLGFSLREARIEAVLTALKPLDERIESLAPASLH